MTNTEIKSKIEEIKVKHEAELSALQKQLEGKKLRLVVDARGHLDIRYGEDIVGVINTLGECHILNYRDQHEAIEQWMEDGRPTDHSIVDWRGGKYRLDDLYRLKRTDMAGGGIYDFTECCPVRGCKDPNLQRYPNGRVKLF